MPGGNMKDFIIDHRTRCKYCLGFPEFYCLLMSKLYHNTDTYKPYNKFKHSLRRKFYYLNPESSMRKNSAQGRSVIVSRTFKMHKSNAVPLRFVIFCKCKRTTWMFDDQSWIADESIENRKLPNDWEKYKFGRL